MGENDGGSINKLLCMTMQVNKQGTLSHHRAIVIVSEYACISIILIESTPCDYAWPRIPNTGNANYGNRIAIHVVAHLAEKRGLDSLLSRQVPVNPFISINNALHGTTMPARLYLNCLRHTVALHRNTTALLRNQCPILRHRFRTWDCPWIVRIRHSTNLVRLSQKEMAVRGPGATIFCCYH